VENPLDRPEPSGFCVRLVNIQGTQELCQEKEYFFTPTTKLGSDLYEEVASSYLLTLEEIKAGNVDLESGTYSLGVHAAWKGNENDPHDWDDTCSLLYTKFTIRHETVVEIL